MAEKRQVILDIQVRGKDAQKELEGVQKRLKENSESQKLLNKQLKDGKISLEAYGQATTAVKLDSAALRKEQSSLTRQILNTNKATDAAEDSNDQLRAQLSLLTAEYNSLSKAEREGTERGNELRIQTRKLSDEIKDNEKVVGDNRRNVGNYASAFEGLSGALDKVIPGFGNIVSKGKDAGGALEGLASKGGKLGSVAGGLAKKLGGPLVLALTALFGAGIKAAEAIAQIAREFDPLQKQVNALTGATGGSLDELTGKVKGIADTFGQDFNEVLTAANTVSKSFGITINEALDQIGDGFVNGANASGEYLSVLNEYPALLEDVGLGFEKTNALLLAQTQAGIYSDAGIATIEEAGIRLRELTPATRAALDGIGLVSDEIEEGLRTGSVEIFDVVQQVSSRLGELEKNSPEVGAAIADIFGGPGEKAGLDYIKLLANVQDNLEDVTLVSEEYRESQEKDLQVTEELAVAKSELGAAFAPVVKVFDRFGKQVLTVVIQGFNNLLDFFTITLPAAFKGGTALVENFATNLANQVKVIGLNIEIAAAEIENFFSTSDEVERRLQNLRSERDAIKESGREYGEVFSEAYNAEFEKREAEARGRAAVLRAKEAAELAKVRGGAASGGSVSSGQSPQDAAKAEAERQKAELTALKEGIQERIAEEKIGLIQIEQDRLISDERKEQLTIERQRRLIELQKQLALAGLNEESAEARLIVATAEAEIAQIQIDADNKVLETRLANSQAERDAITQNAEAEKAAADERVRLAEEEAAMERVIQEQELLYQQELSQQKTSIAAQTFGAAADLLGEQTALGKAAAIAEATINTYVSASQALATPPGPPFTIPLAGIAVAAGLKTVSQIAGVNIGFADGGHTGNGFGSPDSSGFKPAGIVHAGEYVVPSRVLAQPVARSMVNRLEGMRVGGYAAGGFVGVTAQARQVEDQVNQSKDLAMALLNAPAPVVDVREINTVQKRVTVKQTTGNL